MSGAQSVAVAVTVVALVAYMWAEYARIDRARHIAKPTASLGFIAVALVSGATGSAFGVAVLAALVLSMVGDVALLGRSHRAFLIGLGAFLVAHLAFAAAFGLRGTVGQVAVLTAGACATFGAIVFLKLLRRIPPPLRVPVAAYITVICCMVGAAAGATAAGATWLVGVGAIAFFASDLAVALERFVNPGFTHRAWGLPLYYGAQILLALSVAA